MIKGFNLGQIFHFISMQHPKCLGLPPVVVNEIHQVTPRSLLDNVRFSGTMSNYMNLKELGFGQHDNTITMWTQLSNRRHNLLQRLQFAANLILKRRAQLFSSLQPWVEKSYILDVVELYRQLGCKTMAFTFNSHMPYINHCSLEDSIESLKYIKDRTNLISVELENETFFAEYIIGTNSPTDYEKKIDQFINYLEFVVTPAVLKVTGKNMPIGLSVCDNRTSKFRYWNSSISKLADRLKSQGVKVFLVPHIYSSSYTANSIANELDFQAAHFMGKFELRITEFNAVSEAGNCGQEMALDYINIFEKVCQSNHPQVSAIYYHSLYTVKGAHFSFVK